MTRQLHGFTKGRKPPEYYIWSTMVRRCTNPKNTRYINYGGRGITVCDRWKDNFAYFIADMGWRPTPEFSLDRIDNDGDYEPENCRWATKYQQHQNRSNTIKVEDHGEYISLKEYCRRHGLKYGSIVSRVYRGWSPQAAVQPGRRWGRRSTAERAVEASVKKMGGC